MSKIRQYNSDKKIYKNELYRKAIGELIVNYIESPPRQMSSATIQKIIDKLYQLSDSQQPVNQQKNNDNALSKARVESAVKPPTKQGTRIHDYLIRFSETLEDDKSYEIKELKSNFFCFLQEQASKPQKAD
jgi:hypothetical protein